MYNIQYITHFWSAATQYMSVPTTVIITVHLLTCLSFQCLSWQLLIPGMETSWLCSNASIYYIKYITCNVQFLIGMSCLETWHWILVYSYLFFNIMYMYFHLLHHKNINTQLLTCNASLYEMYIKINYDSVIPAINRKLYTFLESTGRKCI